VAFESVLKLANTDPNFSIVVPGPCNAKCQFCFWRESDSELTKAQYLAVLSQALQWLPRTFQQCSITGGEPTASPYLADILPLVAARFPKVVLSSNGFDVQDWMFQHINHLNLSRHHWIDANNRARFGVLSIPDASTLSDICARANQRGVDVTLNCVIPSDFNDLYFVQAYIEFAKCVGANAVCFRKEHGDLTDIPVEASIPNKVIQCGECPVCRSKVRLMRGMRVSWRYSVIEPSEVVTDIYELAFQPDGRLTADWAGNSNVVRFEAPPEPRVISQHSPTVRKPTPEELNQLSGRHFGRC